MKNKDVNFINLSYVKKIHTFSEHESNDYEVIENYNFNYLENLFRKNKILKTCVYDKRNFNYCPLEKWLSLHTGECTDRLKYSKEKKKIFVKSSIQIVYSDGIIDNFYFDDDSQVREFLQKIELQMLSKSIPFIDIEDYEKVRL